MKLNLSFHRLVISAAEFSVATVIVARVVNILWGYFLLKMIIIKQRVTCSILTLVHVIRYRRLLLQYASIGMRVVYLSRLNWSISQSHTLLFQVSLPQIVIEHIAAVTIKLCKSICSNHHLAWVFLTRLSSSFYRWKLLKVCASKAWALSHSTHFI